MTGPADGPPADTSPRVPLGELWRRGSTMGLVLMLPGIKWLVILAILGSISPAAVTAFGLAQTIYGLALALTSGLTIATIGALTRRRGATLDRRDTTAQTASMLAVARVSTVALLTLVALTGSVLVIALDGPTALLLTASYVGLVLSCAVVPWYQVIAGVLQVAGRERVTLKISMASVAASLALAAAARAITSDPLTLVTVVGVTTSLCELVGAAASRHAARDLLDWRGAGRVASTALRLDLRQTIGRLPSAIAPSLDVLPLMTTFAVATYVASTASVEAGAATATVIALLRTLIVPLKAFGVVAGRLTRVYSTSPVSEVRECARIVGLLLVASITTGALVIILRGPLAAVLGLPDAVSSTILFFAGAQLMLEAVTGVGNTMLKVLVAPTTLLAEISIVMWGLALPALALVAHSGASAELVWTVLLGARLVFATLVLLAWARWARRSTNASRVVQ